MRIAVVGAGQFGRKHIDTVRKEPACTLAAVADPVQAADFGVPHYALYTEMLEREKPDGVIIATPNALHVSVGLACVARGIPMLVEKPVADTVDASRRLVDAAERARVPLLVGHHRRHNPIIEKARELVQGGALGRLAAVAALWLVQKPAEYYDVGWRREPGGGPLLINLIHDIDDLRYICGEIVEVRAITSNAVRGFAVEDSAAVTLRFANGALGTATVSDAVPAPWSWELASGENPAYPQQPENCYWFSGTEGSLALPRLELWTYGERKGWHAPLQREQLQVQAADPQARQLQHFCRVIRGEEAPRSSGADATRTLAVIAAVHEAARTGKAVQL
ncbi:MAG TPA: Gfo/Idh/MocA family oxidoreductase [Burkholderiales bacterium]|nr:Gfo/Idh/MocA family oxidoreductase [Burkholderiales bacterium]